MADLDLITFSDCDLVTIQPAPAGITLDNINPLHMQVRSIATDPTVWIELTTANGYLVVDATNNLLTITIPQSKLENLPPGIYVYSIIQSVRSSVRTEVFRGTLTHSAGPTQWQQGTP